MSQALTAPAILLFTLYLVLARPRNLDTGLAALIGAVLALLFGVITPIRDPFLFKVGIGVAPAAPTG